VILPSLFHRRSTPSPTAPRITIRLCIYGFTITIGDNTMNDRDETSDKSAMPSLDDILYRAMQPAEEPGSARRPPAPQVSDAEATAIAASNKSIGDDLNRRSSRALVLNAWVRQMQLHRGPSFMIGAADILALELAERAIDGVPREDPEG
jgi:hypothetical protein